MQIRKNKEFLFGIKSDGTAVIKKYLEHASRLQVPSLLGGYRVTIIAEGAFCGFTGQSIVLPDSVVEIGDGAFEQCSSLSEIKLPDSLVKIGFGAFMGCTGLTEITIPASVKQIGRLAFLDCVNLRKINLPESKIHIGDLAFWGCTNLTLHEK